MRKKDPGQRACKICVSIPAEMVRQVDDAIDSMKPLAPSRSAVVQIALRDWLEANADRLAGLDGPGDRRG